MSNIIKGQLDSFYLLFPAIKCVCEYQKEVLEKIVEKQSIKIGRVK